MDTTTAAATLPPAVPTPDQAPTPAWAGPGTAGSPFSLTVSEDGFAVKATFTPPAPATDSPTPVAVAPTTGAVREWLTQGGWGDWWVDTQTLDKWCQQIPMAKAPLTATVAQRLDGRCTVTVARDRMRATLTLTRPQGGTALTLEQVEKALADKGVKAGILSDALADAVARGEANEREVARGQAAINGEHTLFERLVADMAERHPHVYEDGWVDYRDLGDLVVVKAGTPLLRRVPPTPGTPGFDVSGNTLPPKPGTSWPFAPGLKGVEPAPGDADLLVASVTGQPVMVSHGVKVDPNIVLPQVDLSTGNVSFDGAVQIKGDVKDGMKVTSTGDVVVGGAVLAGEIEAGGNVTVKGGVIGHSEYNGHLSDRNSWFSAKVVAKGKVHARYAENAFLQSDTDVVVDDYAMHSEITAFHHVTIGKPGTPKGRCIGGHTRAGITVRVAESGSEAGPTTVLQAGTQPQMEEELSHVTKAIEKHQAEIANLHKIIDFVHQHPERDQNGLLGRATLTQELHEGQILELQAQQTDLQASLHLAEGAHVLVEWTVHGGTEVRVGGKTWRTADTRRRGRFSLNADGEWVLG